MRRVLVVNADDFGRSRAINRGVVLAYERGIVTSASAMVRWPAAEEAAGLAAERPALGVGLHVDLGEWEYRDAEWRVVYAVVPPEDASAVSAEVDAQLARFRMLFGSEPTHLDSHQHVHRREPARSILVRLGEQLGVPVRHFGAVRYEGSFHGQDASGAPLPEAISAERLAALIRDLPAGTTELACHPGAEPEAGSGYARERPRELEALCDPRVRAAVEAHGIELCSF